MKNIKEACEGIPSKKIEEIDFLSWFNGASSVDESLSTGFTDFMYKIMSNDTCKLIGDPSKATCLEIGFGGGRLLLPASFTFKKTIGIDIHDQFERVSDLITRHDRRNFELLRPEDAEKITNASVDFVYSFIAFQHFLDWDVAENYLHLIRRVLKKNGLAMIYMGENKATNDDVFVVQPSSFDEFPTTLHVKRDFALEKLRSLGFNVIECSTTTKRPWLDAPSGQFFVKFTNM